MQPPANNARPKHGARIIVKFLPGHGGSSTLQILEALPHGLLARLPWKSDVLYIPWSEVASWKAEEEQPQPFIP